MKHSTYMHWAKHHAAARYNLANSGMLACTTDDLPIHIEDIEINGANLYGYRPLIEAIAAQYDVAPDCVTLAQGTSMANFLTLATLLERGDEVLIERPAYDPFLSAAAYLGADIKRFERRFENGWQIDVSELQRMISSRTRLIVLSSPHNPSGVVTSPEDLRQIGEAAQSVGAKVLVDEVYRDILCENAAPVSLHLGSQFIVTSSLTKSYGLSGLRCGWILCEAHLAERLRRLNDLLGAVGVMSAEKFSQIAFQHIGRLTERSRRLITANQQIVYAFLREHEDFLETVTPAHSMIVFPRLRHHPSADALYDHLRKYETSIVPGRFFEYPNHFRLGFGIRTEDVTQGLRHLSQALREIR
jgi:hypothetical protein